MDFAYLEADYIDSESFVITETVNWQRLRLLRVMSKEINSGWPGLRSSGKDILHLDFPGAWMLAHQAYGLAIVTADFKAIREALSYLQLLYDCCGVDSAAIADIAARYGLIAANIFKGSEPDTEARYAVVPDPMKASTKMDCNTLLPLFVEWADSCQTSEMSRYLIREW